MKVVLRLLPVVSLFLCLIMACSPAYSNEHKLQANSLDTASCLRLAAINSAGAAYFFIADLSRSSGANRFMVIDTKQKRIIASGLCCSGRTDASGHTMYSNEEGSHCSAKGIYRIAERYTGTYGLAYRLDGLSPTNSNARARNVVLHAHESVPAAEDPSFSVQSFGCVTLNPGFLQKVDGFIKACGSRAPGLIVL